MQFIFIPVGPNTGPNTARTIHFRARDYKETEKIENEKKIALRMSRSRLWVVG